MWNYRLVRTYPEGRKPKVIVAKVFYCDGRPWHYVNAREMLSLQEWIRIECIAKDKLVLDSKFIEATLMGLACCVRTSDVCSVCSSTESKQ